MGIFRQFPYSNFHEMNMDQLIKIMREMQDEWAETKTEWASYKEFIDNYFSNLDVSEEVLQALRALAASGELNEIIDPVIANAVTDWLDENISPTTPIVDKTLSISGAAADAKITGDIFDHLNDDLILKKFNIVNDEYVLQNNGEFAPYTGWSRSGYIPVTPTSIIMAQSPERLTYCAFYDSDQTFIQSFALNPAYPLAIPKNVEYIAISGTTATMAEVKLYELNTFVLKEIAGNMASYIVPNQYCTGSDGSIRNYNGYERSLFIDIRNIELISLNSKHASTNNCIYDEDFNLLYPFSVNAGDNIISSQPNAAYMILSGETNYVRDIVVSAAAYTTTQTAEYIKRAITTNLNGNYSLLVNYADIDCGKGIDENGQDVVKADYGCTKVYYKLINTESKFRYRGAGSGVYIHQYMENTDGTFTYIGRSVYLSPSNPIFWANSNCTHIRLEIYSNTNTFTEYEANKFTQVFSLDQINDINDYLRVCTFNQAANYPHFMSATEEDLNKRVIKYLNFIGEYNPDIICAQEAVATYFQPVSYQKNTANVFNRKYLFNHQSGYQRKTWSKYNYSRYERIVFNDQAPDDERFYSKETIHFNGKEIVLLNTHCAYYGESDFDSVRKKQFQQLKAEMDQHEYCILCGDFNAWSAAEYDIFTGYQMANCGEYGIIDTWYVDTPYPEWPFKAVDNIIVSNNIKIQNVVRGPYDFDYFSDHAPLLVDLQIR